MFQSRKGLWFPLSILILYASIGFVCSTKQDEDTIGNAFGSLFKAILNVVKSQFEATKDFVPGLDTAGGGTVTNDTDQVDMKMGIKSKDVFVNDESFDQGSTSFPSIHEDVSFTSETEDHGTFTEESIEEESVESTIPRPGPEKQGQSVSENGDADQASSQEHRGQSMSEELNPDQTSSQRTGDRMTNQADTTVPLTTNEQQSTYPEVALGNRKLPVVSFSSAEALSPEESLQGMSGVQGADAWPFQPDVKEMLGVLEQEITEPLDTINSMSNVGEEELDKAGFVHAENMTEVEVSTIETIDRQSGSLIDHKVQNSSNADVQYQSQETESKMSNHDGTELELSESLSYSIDNLETNDSGTTGLDLDDNLSSSVRTGNMKLGEANGEKALSNSLNGLPVPKEDGEKIWPFQQDIGGMVQTLEKELNQHGISPPGKLGQGPSQGHDNVYDEGQNNDKTIEQSGIKEKDGNIQADNALTKLSNEESVDQKKSHSSGGTKDTKGSDESNMLLRLVNTV